MGKFLEKYFKLSENKTNVSTEVIAGITTFMTMAYIIVVNPSILADAGMDWGSVFTATCVSAFIATMIMGLYAKYPFVLAPAMGLNAFFAYTVAANYGWEVALLAVFVEGLCFMALSLFNVRESLFNCIPRTLKLGITVGIGLFITFIGLKNAQIVVADPATYVALGDFTNITVTLAAIGTVITLVLMHKKVKGAIFLGIVITWGLGIICQLTGIYVVNPEMGMYSLIPEGIVSRPPPITNTIMDSFTALSEGEIQISLFDFLVVVFSFMFVDIFDTIGTLIGVSEKSGFLDENGELPRVKQALFADAVGTTVGAALGTSTVTTYVESAAGVAEGGRTGLTAVVAGLLFLAALFFSPIFSAIPSFATAPALICVGLLMISGVGKINFDDITEGFPAFIAIIMMPLTFSISEGIVFGCLSYIALKLFTGKRKDISPVLWVIGVLFIIELYFG